MNERREKYHAVNSQWPAAVPELTGPEAIAAAKRLYRFAMKRSFKGKFQLVSGNRYTWIWSGKFLVNPKYTGRGAVNGRHDLVHFISHLCSSRLHPNAKSHGPQHHFLEKEMVEYVIRSGWLEGKLKRPKRAKASPVTIRAGRIEAGIKRWTAKLRRAETALRKLRRRKAYYERRS
jgi:hypothetical protein